jgi:MFS family permease
VPYGTRKKGDGWHSVVRDPCSNLGPNDVHGSEPDTRGFGGRWVTVMGDSGTNALYAWLTGSVGGIIVLGAIGSLVGAILLHFGKHISIFLLRWLGARILAITMPCAMRLLLVVSRVVMVHARISERLMSKDDKTLFAAFYVSSVVSMAFSIGLFLVFLSAAVIFIGLCGLQHPFLSAFLVAMTLLMSIACIGDCAVYLYVHGTSLIGRYERKLEKTYNANPSLLGMHTRRVVDGHRLKSFQKRRNWGEPRASSSGGENRDSAQLPTC